jgi:ParB/RepB/Spo0J family partition protein
VKKSDVVNGPGFKESQKKMYDIDVRHITSSLNDNHRYPGTKAMMEAGYGLFESLPTHPEFKPLWNLATSDDLAERAEFLRVMNLYEGTNPAEPTIIDLATSMHSSCEGQIHPISVRNNGKKGTRQTFTVVAGHRRMLAVLWRWCSGMVKSPIIEAKFVKGNSLSLTALQKDENVLRKQVSPIIVAQGYQRSLNGGASLDQVAKANGVSEQTVKQWLEFLELEPQEQKKLEENKLRHADAHQIVADRRAGGEGKTKDGLSAEQAATERPAKGGTRNRKKGKMTTKKLTELYNNPPSNWKGVTPAQVKFILGVLLGEHNDQGVFISAADAANAAPTTEFVAVVPAEGAAVGLMNDDDFDLDDNGNIVVKS